MLFVRPEAMLLGHGENQLLARMRRRDLEGAFLNLFFDAQGTELAVHITNDGQVQVPSEGDTKIGFHAESAVILPSGPLARTGQELAAQ